MSYCGMDESTGELDVRRKMVIPIDLGRSDTPPPVKSEIVVNSTDDGLRRTIKIEEMVAGGGFASVYRGVDAWDGTVVAVKVIPTHGISIKDMDRVRQETKISKKAIHRNLVRLIGATASKPIENHRYLVLEYCHNKTLSHILIKRTRLTETESCYYTREVLRALEYLHFDLHVLHNDVKLRNILVSKEMNVKLCDFGLSTQIKKKRSTHGVCGTVNYVAPEILKKRGGSIKSDVWSVGCCLFGMLTGELPFKGTTFAETTRFVRKASLPSPPEGVLSESAWRFIRRLLKYNEHNRPDAEKALEDSFLAKEKVPSHLLIAFADRDPLPGELEKILERDRLIRLREGYGEVEGEEEGRTVDSSSDDPLSMPHVFHRKCSAPGGSRVKTDMNYQGGWWESDFSLARKPVKTPKKITKVSSFCERSVSHKTPVKARGSVSQTQSYGSRMYESAETNSWRESEEWRVATERRIAITKHNSFHSNEECLPENQFRTPESTFGAWNHLKKFRKSSAESAKQNLRSFKRKEGFEPSFTDLPHSSRSGDSYENEGEPSSLDEDVDRAKTYPETGSNQPTTSSSSTPPYVVKCHRWTVSSWYD